MCTLTQKALNDARIRIGAQDVARAWRRLCKNTGKRPITDDIFSSPGFEREKLTLVMALSQLTEELSQQDGWDSTNPDCPRPDLKDKPMDSGDACVDVMVKSLVEEAIVTLKQADMLHGQPLYYTAEGFPIDVDKTFAATIEGLDESIDESITGVRRM